MIRRVRDDLEVNVERFGGFNEPIKLEALGLPEMQARAAANAVDLSKKSTFNFDALSLNPIFEVSTSTNNVVQVKDSTLGMLDPLQPDLTDKRVAFYTSINATILPKYRISGFGAAAATPFPVYLPGEMILIKGDWLVIK